jgi:hypothetical protein
MLPGAHAIVRTLTVNVCYCVFDRAQILACNCHHALGNSHSTATKLKCKGLAIPSRSLFEIVPGVLRVLLPSLQQGKMLSVVCYLRVLQRYVVFVSCGIFFSVILETWSCNARF